MAAAQRAPQQLERIDRLVAVVDEDPIFESDLRRLIDLGLVGAQASEPSLIVLRRALDRLIDDRLRLHEIERYDVVVADIAEVRAQVEALMQSLGGEAELERRLAAAAMTRADLESLFAQQLRILGWVEERLGARVFVTSEEIEEYYDQTLKPELERAGQELPAIDDVREQIREVLRQQKLNRELDRWTRDLRREADVVDLLDRATELPPVRDRREASPPP